MFSYFSDHSAPRRASPKPRPRLVDLPMPPVVNDEDEENEHENDYHKQMKSMERKRSRKNKEAEKPETPDGGVTAARRTKYDISRNNQLEPVILLFVNLDLILSFFQTSLFLFVYFQAFGACKEDERSSWCRLG